MQRASTIVSGVSATLTRRCHFPCGIYSASVSMTSTASHLTHNNNPPIRQLSTCTSLPQRRIDTVDSVALLSRHSRRFQGGDSTNASAYLVPSAFQNRHPHPHQHTLIGILGGVGPMVGVKFQEHLIKKTPATRDQDHLSVVHMCCPAYIEDRNTFLMHSQDSQRLTSNPGHDLFEVAKGISYSARALGMNAIVGCPSISFHASAVFKAFQSDVAEWNSKLLGKGKLSVVNMIDATLDHVRDDMKLDKVGLLSNTAMRRSHVFSAAASKKGISVIEVDEEIQKKIDTCVYHPEYGIKALSYGTDSVVTQLEDGVYDLMYHGAECVILGSTELALALHKVPGATLIDPMDILASELIRAATI